MRISCNGDKYSYKKNYDVDVGSVGIETSILPEGDTFFSFRLCMVIFPAKATNNPHGLRMRLTIGVRSEHACVT